MRIYFSYLLSLALLWLLGGCKTEEFIVPAGSGEPQLELMAVAEEALFGDSLLIRVHAEDQQVDLSTLKMELLFSEEVVSQNVLRTKDYGRYESRLYIPFLKGVPDGTAMLRLTLENVERVRVIATQEIDLKRPDFPYLNLVTAEETFKLERTQQHQYTLDAKLPMKVSGYLESPAFGVFGNTVQFGWDGQQVLQGLTQPIPFSNSQAGHWSISFQTFSYQASPFLTGYSVNGEAMEMLTDQMYKIDLDLEQHQSLDIQGIEGFQAWWLDPDFIQASGDELLFSARTGRYRVIADFSNEYLAIEALDGDDPATLSDDGTGAVWVIGEGIGKPSISSNNVSWNTDKALCMAPIGEQRYRISLVAGTHINLEEIDFKFFHQKDWGGEFSSQDITTDSDLIFIGDGDNGRDSGNLGVLEGQILEAGRRYIFELDLSAGKHQAVLHLRKE